MSRERRAALARHTLAICEAGQYDSRNGKRVTIADALAKAKASTVIYSPEQMPKPATRVPGRTTQFEVRNETAFQALARHANVEVGHLACLNFASAKNPGGGFLNGAIAQEEALAYASGLYPCLLEAREFYDRNRANRSALYLDYVIFSPLVPFIRTDAGDLLDEPILASIITAPAPNAGAIAQNEPANLQHVQPVLKRRAGLVLQIAAAHGVEQLVLGAWGCGVFRNDPNVVAKTFADLLASNGPYAHAFAKVIFAVFDLSDSQATYKAFANCFRCMTT